MEQMLQNSQIFSALVVPMHEDETINYDSLEQLVDLQLTQGVEGFYCCGSSGEGLLLTLEEREKILEKVIRRVDGRVPVIAHVGTIRTKDVIRLAEHAKNAGANAISMIPPYYYKFSMKEITEYYKEVIHAVPDIPVLIYNIPQFTGVEFSKDNASQLLEEARILGIKHTSKDLYSLERMHTVFPEKRIYNGFDEQFLGALSMGADATIGTTVNLYAETFRDIRDYYYSGNYTGALELQKQLNEKIEIMCKYGIFSAVKYLLSKRDIPCGSCRKPFEELSEQAMKELDKIGNAV